MSVTITYFVHGTTTDNEQHLGSGWNPGELSERGKRESKELALLIADKHFDAVFCSDLKRAVDSAELAFGSRYTIIQDQRLREGNWGDHNGKPIVEFKHQLDRYIEERFPNGENFRDVEKRMADFLRSLKREYDGKRIAIIAHQAPQLALDVLLKGKTWQQAINEDWRKTTSWKPGWEYVVK